MNIKKSLLLVSSLLSIISCMPQKPLAKPDEHAFKQIEPLLSYSLSKGKIQFEVTSTGCTQPASFLLETERVNKQCHISLYRIKPDFCRKAPFSLLITLPLETNSRCEQYIVMNSSLKNKTMEK